MASSQDPNFPWSAATVLIFVTAKAADKHDVDAKANTGATNSNAIAVKVVTVAVLVAIAYFELSLVAIVVPMKTLLNVFAAYKHFSEIQTHL